MSEQSVTGEGGLASKICLCPGVGRFYRRRGPAPRALPLPDPRLPAQREGTHPFPGLAPHCTSLGWAGRAGAAACCASLCRGAAGGTARPEQWLLPAIPSRGRGLRCGRVCTEWLCVFPCALMRVPAGFLVSLRGRVAPIAFLEFPKLYVGATPFWAAPPLPAGLHVVTREPHLQPRLQTFSPGSFPA